MRRVPAGRPPGTSPACGLSLFCWMEPRRVRAVRGPMASGSIRSERRGPAAGEGGAAPADSQCKAVSGYPEGPWACELRRTGRREARTRAGRVCRAPEGAQRRAQLLPAAGRAAGIFGASRAQGGHQAGLIARANWGRGSARADGRLRGQPRGVVHGAGQSWLPARKQLRAGARLGRHEVLGPAPRGSAARLGRPT